MPIYDRHTIGDGFGIARKAKESALASNVLAALPVVMRLPFICCSIALLAACSTTAPSAPRIGKGRSAIINGVADKTHPAVVALLLGENDSFEGSCSGTIVKVDAKHHVGWVATAAHCVEPGVFRVVQANDYGKADAIAYAVLDATADPSYRNLENDFGVVRIVGVDASTPVIPLTTAPDDLAVGMSVTSVGYGVTEETDNSERRSIDKPIDRLTAALIAYEQSTSGICSGDSGGPVLAGTGEGTRVVGIHSYGALGCAGEAYSMRVTNGLEFLEAQLARPLPEPSCELCQMTARSGTSACAALTSACRSDETCSGYEECVALGKKDAAECAKDFPLAEGPSVAATSCACGGACAKECAASDACKTVGECGAKLHGEDACTSCVESSCCEETLDCTVDGRCYVCLTDDDSFPSCKENEARLKLAACVVDKCASECAGSTLATIGTTTADAGVEESDAGEAPSASTSSCACKAAPSEQSSWAPFALAALALIAQRRRASTQR